MRLWLTIDLIEVVVACYGRKSRFADASAQYFYSPTELCQGSLSTITDGSETRVWIMGFCQWLKFYGFSEVMQVTVYHRFTGSIGSQGEKSVRNCIESRGISQILSRRVRFTLWPLEQLGWWGWGSNTDWTTTQWFLVASRLVASGAFWELGPYFLASAPVLSVTYSPLNLAFFVPELFIKRPTHIPSQV